MSVRRHLITALSRDSRSLIAALADVEHAEQLADAHRTEVLAADGQAYDGELSMLRGLVRTLRAVVRDDNAGVGEVRRLLHQHAAADATAREKATAPAAPATPERTETTDPTTTGEDGAL